MRLGIQKWGNSLALRIPESFATEAALELGSEIDLALVEGRLILTPMAEPGYRLDDLLARITPGNRHREAGTGPRIGAEVW